MLYIYSECRYTFQTHRYFAVVLSLYSPQMFKYKILAQFYGTLVNSKGITPLIKSWRGESLGYVTTVSVSHYVEH
jgi:hypothetical protein